MTMCNRLYVCVCMAAAFPVCLEHALCIHMLFINHSVATQVVHIGTTALYRCLNYAYMNEHVIVFRKPQWSCMQFTNN